MKTKQLSFWTGVVGAFILSAVPACNCGSSGVGSSCSSAADCSLGLACAANGECEQPGFDAGAGVHVAGGCVNLACSQAHCAPDSGTTLTGHVYDPSGTLPLYNAIVYVPNGTVEPFTDGVTCDVCGTFTSGSPLVNTLTGPDGAFTLTDVPAGKEIPVVFQIGKWRRQVTIPAVTACQENALTDVNQQRLPRNQSEGDLPKMAIATGGADPMECLLLKIGLDPAEFTDPDNGGRIQMFYNNFTTATTGPGIRVDGNTPTADNLWRDAGTLHQYDLVLLPCEGGEDKKPAGGLQNIVDYTSSGGRVFATHYSYVWTAFGAAPFPTTADWTPDRLQIHDPPDPFAVAVNQSFPKGQAFEEWLSNVGALDGGLLDLSQSRNDVAGVNPDAGTTSWLSGAFSANGGTLYSAVEHLTFNMPLDPPPLADGGPGAQCGRVVFSDFHVTTDALTDAGTFPASCAGGPLTSQEKALLFMLFDVSSCIQSDSQAPAACGVAAGTCSAAAPCCAGLACENSAFNPCGAGEACTCEPVVN